MYFTFFDKFILSSRELFAKALASIFVTGLFLYNCGIVTSFSLPANPAMEISDPIDFKTKPSEPSIQLAIKCMFFKSYGSGKTS